MIVFAKLKDVFLESLKAWKRTRLWFILKYSSYNTDDRYEIPVPAKKIVSFYNNETQSAILRKTLSIVLIYTADYVTYKFVLEENLDSTKVVTFIISMSNYVVYKNNKRKEFSSSCSLMPIKPFLIFGLNIIIYRRDGHQSGKWSEL